MKTLGLVLAIVVIVGLNWYISENRTRPPRGLPPTSETAPPKKDIATTPTTPPPLTTPSPLASGQPAPIPQAAGFVWKRGAEVRDAMPPDRPQMELQLKNLIRMRKKAVLYREFLSNHKATLAGLLDLETKRNIQLNDQLVPLELRYDSINKGMTELYRILDYCNPRK